ncbi:Spermatogenesis associated 5 [Nesidiocoris tenuis]|uniref:Spermatogenesis associated 5 n=1 Tax=Nesidiocoris tenuis TaxID=355587 RepID=A0ABN7AKB0_9HEMI|nr:Spermatogenesis associated 5 [Nesidiocoris tenuis]
MEKEIATCLKIMAENGFGLSKEEVIDVVANYINENNLVTRQPSKANVPALLPHFQQNVRLDQVPLERDFHLSHNLSYAVLVDTDETVDDPPAINDAPPHETSLTHHNLSTSSADEPSSVGPAPPKRQQTLSDCILKMSSFEEGGNMGFGENGYSADQAQLLKAKTEERELHLRKSEEFYNAKARSRKRAAISSKFEAITKDYQENLPTPNITTNDVYYKRQLNCVSFNIHVLSTNHAIFYTYDESVAKKGADEVCSMLNHFVNKILPPEGEELEIFCDSCAGQN